MGLKAYESYKRVHAMEIGRIEGTTLYSPDGSMSVAVSAEYIGKHPLNLPGYYVRYADGYESWSPKSAFEEGYVASAGNGMSFGAAVACLKKGQRVARDGWNGKNMFLFLVAGSRFKVNRPPLLGIYPEGAEVQYHAHIDMKTAQGYVVPWLASQADMLAEDWYIVAAKDERQPELLAE